MDLRELEQIPVVGGCLAKAIAFAFGLPFVGVGGYLIAEAASTDHPWVSGVLGALAVLTGLLVIIPVGLGRDRWMKPLVLTWFVGLALFLLWALVAKVTGRV